ncbi:MAG TPA: hypothetical protein VHB45_04945 [Alloacidobacterium sp.]|nr:hypothetical protein [Alloacidobacterium sp.]
MARMTILSAADALGPAFRRTRVVLAAPFRLGFFLKNALVAALTQPGFYSVMISYPLQGAQLAAGGATGHAQHMDFTGGGGVAAIGMAVAAVLALAGIALWVLATYLFCRLRFTLFDLVVYRQGRVREAWKKYERQTWRYFGVVLLTSFVFLILATASVGPFFIHMLKTMKAAGAQGVNANPMAVAVQMLPLIGIFALLGLLWVVIDAVLQDFILPPMAVEDAPIESALSRFFTLLREEPGQLFVYLLLRFVVAMGISWALLMAVFIALMLVALAGLAMGFGLYHALWHGGIGLRVVFIVITALMALGLLALYALAMVTVYGTAAVFKQSYAAYFFGGRYRELGDRLEPPEEDFVGVRVEPPLPPLPPLSEPPPVW